MNIPGNPPRGDRNQRPKCLRRPGRSVGHVERSISGRSITQLDLPGRAQVGQSSMSNGRVQLNRSGRSNHSVRSCQSVRSIGPLRSVSHVGYIDQVGSVGQVSHIGQFPQVVGRSCRSDYPRGARGVGTASGVSKDVLPRFMLESLGFAIICCFVSCRSR